MAFGRESPGLAHPDPWWSLASETALALSLTLGIGLAWLTSGSTRWLVRRTGWARRLHVEFRGLVGTPSDRAIAGLALLSGVGEEVFFRAGLQTWVGWLPASIAFGLLHVGGRGWLGAWTLWATLMGLLFGAIYAATGQIWGAIIAHALVNWLNLYFIRDTPVSYGAP